MELDQTQLKEAIKCYLFQEFIVSVSTKKDKEDRIKHNIIRLERKDSLAFAQNNTQPICQK
jgi:hypothetical protein